ncbi:hypothetical protein ACLI1A_15165 [Flavobacterium sp. RHBU_3]|uniref:hypothetical protein n=1 Tax=Flavobacterium sp. RHBU_3 TaxID=3391184 RepID=UPI003984BC23
MKYFILNLILIIVFTTVTVSAQESNYPFYEQLAFNFYQDTILKSYPVKKKISLYPYRLDFKIHLKSLENPGCITGIDSNSQFKPFLTYETAQSNFDSGKLDLEVATINKHQFRIKKLHTKNRYPQLFITSPYLLNRDTDKVFVTIQQQNSETEGVNYHFVLTPKGTIIDWCRTEYSFYIEY